MEHLCRSRVVQLLSNYLKDFHLAQRCVHLPSAPIANAAPMAPALSAIRQIRGWRFLILIEYQKIYHKSIVV
jgi:hypothetical protein